MEVPKKCPKCGAEVSEDVKLYAQQEFSYMATGVILDNGELYCDEFNDLFDVENLNEEGDPEIMGCSNCL